MNKKNYTVIVKIKDMGLSTLNTLYGSVLVTTHPRHFNYLSVKPYNTEFLLQGSEDILELATHKCYSVHQQRADNVDTYKKETDETSWNEIANLTIKGCAPYRRGESTREYASSHMDIVIRIWDSENNTYYPSGHTLSNSDISEFSALGASLMVEVYSNPQLTSMVGVFDIDSSVAITGNGNYNTTRTKYNDSITTPIVTQGKTIYGQWEIRDIILND